MDYKNGKIYKLQCEDGYYYIGSTTTELRKRFKGHKDKSVRASPLVYQHITAIGWDKVRIVLVEDYPCASKEHLLRKEDEIIQAHRKEPMCLNMKRAYLTDEEEKADNEARSKSYHAAHKQEEAVACKKYQETHKEEIKAQRKVYWDAHKDAVNAARRVKEDGRTLEARRKKAEARVLQEKQTIIVPTTM